MAKIPAIVPDLKGLGNAELLKAKPQMLARMLSENELEVFRALWNSPNALTAMGIRSAIAVQKLLANRRLWATTGEIDITSGQEVVKDLSSAAAELESLTADEVVEKIRKLSQQTTEKSNRVSPLSIPSNSTISKIADGLVLQGFLSSRKQANSTRIVYFVSQFLTDIPMPFEVGPSKHSQPELERQRERGASQ